MGRLADYTREAVSGLGGIVIYLLGGFDGALQLLATVIILDYFTGLMKSFVTGELSSDISYKGIVKKAGILVVVAVVTVVDKQQGAGGSLRNTIVNALVINESISSIENLGAINVPLADTVQRWLKELKQKIKDEL